MVRSRASCYTGSKMRIWAGASALLVLLATPGCSLTKKKDLEPFRGVYQVSGLYESDTGCANEYDIYPQLGDETLVVSEIDATGSPVLWTVSCLYESDCRDTATAIRRGSTSHFARRFQATVTFVDRGDAIEDTVEFSREAYADGTCPSARHTVTTVSRGEDDTLTVYTDVWRIPEYPADSRGDCTEAGARAAIDDRECIRTTTLDAYLLSDLPDE